ncbi:MAG: hypothetical protein ABL931_15840 [Usitatibacteraceae bacterium]
MHTHAASHVTRPTAFALLRCGIVLAILSAVASCGGGGGGGSGVAADPPPVVVATSGPAWFGFGRDAQHTAVGAVATQALTRLVWQMPIDLAPQYSGTSLLIHYGSPVITPKNTVLVPVKTGASGAFRIEARSGANGAALWSATSDYILPKLQNWTPSYNLTLTTGNRVYAPGAGGKLIFRDDVDSAAGAMQSAVFYGADLYNAARSTYDQNVIINTPLTVDATGNVFFGFIVNGANSANLVSGIARVQADGRGSWVSASAAAGDASVVKVATNSAPAVSSDGRTVYVAVNSSVVVGQPNGYLVALDSTTLATRSKVRLNDPNKLTPAWISDDGTASPMVGPDGDVYFGVLEASAPSHNFTGWMLHFDATLGQVKTPGAFGWDNTPSVVPRAMVPSYTGPSAYLLMTKYNNYGGAGTGDGKNRIAILDPGQTQADAISGVPVMKEILTMLGPTPDPGYAGGVKEWCINTAAVDPLTRSVLVNSEDGFLYRWDLSVNQFTERIRLNSGTAEAYTPTAIGPDGLVYSINNAVLFAVGK